MKKLVAGLLVGLMTTSAFAHVERSCRTRTNRYGERVTVCRDTPHTHSGSDYGDGFFDGLVASTMMLLTSDILTNGRNQDMIESEITFALMAESEGMDIELSPELQRLASDLRAANPESAASDLDLLEAVLLFDAE
ncbi:hypothetical protein [Bacteriovorax sp. BSW11_IV]|uniref:hypothetical protein n=1 Tax=Bacteriovorax sp. BSW11_IV TaxID=1353529 RepID=UPI0012DC93B2|nr:hypothetical protein [Bacteriovorax sp. BSW11_IV]